MQSTTSSGAQAAGQGADLQAAGQGAGALAARQDAASPVPDIAASIATPAPASAHPASPGGTPPAHAAGLVAPHWLHSTWAGLAGGVLAVLGWASYSVAGKQALGTGFSVGELSSLRYAVPALILVPFYPMLWRSLRGIGLRRLLLLALLAGPLYGWAIMKGLSLAPIADAVVLGPCLVLITTALLSWRLDGVLPSPRQWLGSGLLGGGLVLLSLSSGGTAAHEMPLRWAGDLAFAASGISWGIFTLLLRRWGVAPLTATAGVAGLSLLALTPFALWGLLHSPHSHTLGQWGAQVFLQGVVGGLIALLCYASAVRALGPMRASYFPAFVPGVTMVLAAATGIEQLGAVAVAGVVVLTVGMLIAQSGAARMPVPRA